MLNDVSQTGDPGGALLHNTSLLISALGHRHSNKQRALELLDDLTGGPELLNLKAHTGPNLPTAPNSYKELSDIITDIFVHMNHSHLALQQLACALSSSTQTSLSEG